MNNRFFLAYQCEQCGGIYRAQNDDSANKEAKETFGVDNATENEDMAIVCDDCYKAIMEE